MPRKNPPPSLPRRIPSETGLHIWGPNLVHVPKEVARPRRAIGADGPGGGRQGEAVGGSDGSGKKRV